MKYWEYVGYALAAAGYGLVRYGHFAVLQIFGGAILLVSLPFVAGGAVYAIFTRGILSGPPEDPDGTRPVNALHRRQIREREQAQRANAARAREAAARDDAAARPARSAPSR